MCVCMCVTKIARQCAHAQRLSRLSLAATAVPGGTNEEEEKIRFLFRRPLNLENAKFRPFFTGMTADRYEAPSGGNWPQAPTFSS